MSCCLADWWGPALSPATRFSLGFTAHHPSRCQWPLLPTPESRGVLRALHLTFGSHLPVHQVLEIGRFLTLHPSEGLPGWSHCNSDSIRWCSQSYLCKSILKYGENCSSPRLSYNHKKSRKHLLPPPEQGDYIVDTSIISSIHR